MEAARRRPSHSHSAATISRAKAIGPCGAAWLVCSSQPKASSTTMFSPPARRARSSAAAMKAVAANAAHDAASLMNEPTPPTSGSTHSVLSSSAAPSTCGGLSLPAAARLWAVRMDRPSPMPPIASSAVK